MTTEGGVGIAEEQPLLGGTGLARGTAMPAVGAEAAVAPAMVLARQTAGATTTGGGVGATTTGAVAAGAMTTGAGAAGATMTGVAAVEAMMTEAAVAVVGGGISRTASLPMSHQSRKK